MTSDTPRELSPTERALLARLAQPMPVQARREMNVCADMDLLAISLESTRAAMIAAVSRPEELSPPPTSSAASSRPAAASKIRS